jgi:hypothetical protein
MDWIIGIVTILIILLAWAWYTGKLSSEKYGNYNDLAWAAGLPGTCKTCNSDYDPNFGEVNLMKNTLEATMVPSKVDYYGLPQGQTYFGTTLSDKLPGKLWNVAAQ